MKKVLAISAAVAIIAMAGTAMAVTTNLVVSANVPDVCSVTAGTLSFGALDVVAAPAVSGTSAGVAVTCTKGGLYSVAASLGGNPVGLQAYLKNSATNDKIAYSLTVPAVSPGTGSAQTIAITGSIAAGVYNTASAGTYNDSVVITVTP
jgi:spore coat protein U-like protein